MDIITTIAVVLIFLWLLGIVGVFSIGWFIHVLLAIAVIMILIRIIRGQKVL